MYYQLLKDGYKITISDPQGQYTTSVFWYKDGKVIISNKELGTFPHPFFNDHKATEFDDHIISMLKCFLRITIEKEIDNV